MKNLNIVVIDGNLVKDAEIKDFTNSSKISFSVAVNISDKSCVYVDVVKWVNSENDRKLMSELTKGAHVKVFGSLIRESWEKDGKKNSIMKVSADCIITFEKKAQTETNTAFNASASAFGSNNATEFKSDIPF